ncbi:MAG: competence protein TfoX [Deltaproteobacteria bacterium HGW-Deltaproteobacteria-13]|jgi:TfoX/Sxy family transcriptional regulator of competence genes|nr:MAG: competence protein TfoX [Deltaproteobacteria bacterium HGW-Deltaproteobacteria-13]
MSSDQDFVEFVTDQMDAAGNISYRKMFGEYAIYCDGKVVALICDNQLFVKPTDNGRSYIGDVCEAPPYPGAKLYFLIQDAFEDREWISDLIKITAKELPMPKPKGMKKRSSK